MFVKDVLFAMLRRGEGISSFPLWLMLGKIIRFVKENVHEE